MNSNQCPLAIQRTRSTQAGLGWPSPEKSVRFLIWPLSKVYWIDLLISTNTTTIAEKVFLQFFNRGSWCTRWRDRRLQSRWSALTDWPTSASSEHFSLKVSSGHFALKNSVSSAHYFAHLPQNQMTSKNENCIWKWIGEIFTTATFRPDQGIVFPSVNYIRYDDTT